MRDAATMMVSAPWERDAMTAGPEEMDILTSPESMAWARTEPASKSTMRASLLCFCQSPASLVTNAYIMLIEGPETPTIIGSAAGDATGATTMRVNSARVRRKAAVALVILFSSQFSPLDLNIIADLKFSSIKN